MIHKFRTHPLNTKKGIKNFLFLTFMMFNYLGLAGSLCIDVRTSGQSPRVSCVFVMKCARLPMHNQICGKQVHKLSMPIAQTAVPPKWHLENYLIHFICGRALFTEW